MHTANLGDLSSFLIRQAAAMGGQQVHLEIQAAVLKQALDQQKAGEVVVRLINCTPGQHTSSARVDIRI